MIAIFWLLPFRSLGGTSISRSKNSLIFFYSFVLILCISLLSHGYRVGIVSQTETAALKKISDNRNAPFDRKVTHLFTAATYV